MGVKVVIWSNVLGVIANCPILGAGSRLSKIDYAAQVDEEKGRRAIVSDHPNKQYLLIWVQQGLIGSLSFYQDIAFWFACAETKSAVLNCAIAILTATVVS